MVRDETSRDPLLKTVIDYLSRGWPDKVHENLQSFKNRRLELTTENGCVLWGHRLVIPPNLQKEILNELHTAHLGIVKMKSLARSFVWWPNIDRDTESVTKSCSLCLENNKNPPRSVLHVWEWPEGSSERLHLDFCGPIENLMYIVITDAFSKWVDVREMKDITTESTIKILKEYFSTWGLPKLIVSDNGPAFKAEKFQNFLARLNVNYVSSPPYHPASNGAAENAVKTFKEKFKLLRKEMSRHDALFTYLYSYRSTPHYTTGCSPVELQIGRRLRTRLSSIETVREKVEQSQARQKILFCGQSTNSFREN